MSKRAREIRHTDFAYDLIVLQHAPSDIHAVVVPVRAWHLLVDICVDARHFAAGLLGKAQRKTGRDRCIGRVCAFRNFRDRRIAGRLLCDDRGLLGCKRNGGPGRGLVRCVALKELVI